MRYNTCAAGKGDLREFRSESKRVPAAKGFHGSRPESYQMMNYCCRRGNAARFHGMEVFLGVVHGSYCR